MRGRRHLPSRQSRSSPGDVQPPAALEEEGRRDRSDLFSVAPKLSNWKRPALRHERLANYDSSRRERPPSQREGDDTARHHGRARSFVCSLLLGRHRVAARRMRRRPHGLGHHLPALRLWAGLYAANFDGAFGSQTGDVHPSYRAKQQRESPHEERQRHSHVYPQRHPHRHPHLARRAAGLHEVGLGDRSHGEGPASSEGVGVGGGGRHGGYCGERTGFYSEARPSAIGRQERTRRPSARADCRQAAASAAS